MDQPLIYKLTNHFDSYPLLKYTKGEIITLANEEPEGVSLLISGTVEQYDITAEGNKVTVNIFKPPAFFPMSWAINKTPNTFFFGALTPVTLKQADAEKTVSFLKSNPDITFDLLSRVYKGTDALLRRLMLATSGVAANRLIFEILLDTYRFGSETNDGKYMVHIRQTTLAARSGLARETVSREMRRLEQEELIKRTEQGMIVNASLLEQKLDFTV